MYDNPKLYDLRTSGMAGDLRFWTRVAMETRGRLLELGCGTGRIALELAARGLEVLGLDRSRPMLREAARKMRARALRVGLFQADMRHFRLRQPVERVIVAFQSLHDLPDLDDWRRCLGSATACLSHSGRLVVEEHDPPDDILDRRVARRLRGPEGGVIEVSHRLEVERSKNRVVGEIAYRHLRAGDKPREEIYPFVGSFATAEQFGELARDAGLAVEEIWSGYAQDQGSASDKHRIYVLRRE